VDEIVPSMIFILERLYLDWNLKLCLLEALKASQLENKLKEKI